VKIVINIRMKKIINNKKKPICPIYKNNNMIILRIQGKIKEKRLINH